MTRKYSCPAPFYRDFHSLLKKRKNRKRLRTAVIQPIIFYFCFGGGGERDRQRTSCFSWKNSTHHTVHNPSLLRFFDPLSSVVTLQTARAVVSLSIGRRVAWLPPLPPPPFYLSDMSFFSGGQRRENSHARAMCVISFIPFVYRE